MNYIVIFIILMPYLNFFIDKKLLYKYDFIDNIYFFIDDLIDSFWFKALYFFIFVYLLTMIYIKIIDNSIFLDKKYIFMLFLQIIYYILATKSNFSDNKIVKTKHGNIYFASKSIDWSKEENILDSVNELRENIKKMKSEENLDWFFAFI